MPPGRAHAFRVWKDAGSHTALIGNDHCFADFADHGPIAAGENSCTSVQFEAALAAGAVDLAQPSVTKAAG